MDNKPIKKLYYSIGEVADITDLKPYVLRYWETEFKQLSPTKNRAGNRIYKEEDIELIFRIQDLLYEQKYTIEGARQQLQQSDGKPSGRLEAAKVRESLERLKYELREILELLEDGAENT